MPGSARERFRRDHGIGKEAILAAIEAEAVAAERARLRVLVEELPRIVMAYPPDDPVHRAAVLAALEEPDAR